MGLQVEVVSPEQVLFSGEAEWVKARAAAGDIVFLTGHAPFIGTLQIGVIEIKLAGGESIHAAVHGGFVEVSHNTVTILSDVAELADEIDVERAHEAQARAEEALRQHEEAEEQIAALHRAKARLLAAGAGSGVTAGH